MKTTIEEIISDIKKRFFARALERAKALKKELEELDLFNWLDKNHPDGGNWPNYRASFIDTLSKFREELLGKETT